MATTHIAVLLTKLLLCAIDDEGVMSQAKKRKKERKEKEDQERLEQQRSREQEADSNKEKTRPLHRERAGTNTSEEPLESPRIRRLSERERDRGSRRRSSYSQHHASSSGSSYGQRRESGHSHRRRDSHRTV